MFLIPTYVAESSIHGVGVYTSVAIPPKTVIWKFHPEVDWKLSAEDIEQFPEPYQSKFRSYCFREESGLYVYCGDNAKYMNHSFAPNCDDEPNGLFTITNQEIPADTELTCDYRTFDLESAEDGLEGWRATNHQEQVEGRR